MEYDLDAMDMDVLNEAHTLLKKRWPEMVEGYLEDVHMYIANIKAGFESGDKQAVASSAHPLKSSSNGMGVIGLGEIAKKMEYDAKEAIENGGNIDHLQALVPLLEDALSRAEPKLRATLDDTT
ncbi:MAG: Hpt domain-containing protein [Alphaproteobacteria bacterium]|nr:Hpt domain-containing protein [Alphaproteobacteria bacterium]